MESAFILQIIPTFICCVVTVIVFFKNNSRFEAQTARENGVIEEKLDSISKVVEKIQKQNDISYAKETKAEENIKTLFKSQEALERRILTIEERCMTKHALPK